MFVDGCFWHGCPEHHTLAATNSDFWLAKLETNRMRDADTDSQLQEAGWFPLRIWEHIATDVAADMVEATLRRRHWL